MATVTAAMMAAMDPGRGSAGSGAVPTWVGSATRPGGRATDEDLDTSAALYREQYPPMLRLACAVLGALPDGEDAVQEAFATCAAALPRLAPSERIPYLRTAVMNACLKDKRRARAIKRQPVRTRSATATVEDRALEFDDRRRVGAALDELSVRQRQCVALRYYEQLNDAEIAATLGVSVGSAKTHLRRGLEALRQHLEGSR
jgi:RNA polymerase sigma factor (sigma-70 family)